MRPRSFLAFLGLFPFALFPSFSVAQSPTSPGNSPTFTLHANSRIVLTDLTVTDRNGNPVHNLPRSAFQVLDNSQPQAVASFEEHRGGAPTAAAAASSSNGVYSNAFLQHLPPVLNILVIDTTNLELEDQMYLRFQLTKFVAAVPAGQQLAVYEHHGDNAVLLQNFTADHTLLLTAVQNSLPRIVLTGREYRSDTQTLHQIAVDLAQVPGRKNVLWFSGGSPLFLMDGLSSPGAISSSLTGVVSNPSIAPSATASADLRKVYDELESARIAIFPIDARGLTASGSDALTDQQMRMNDVAESTGGRAFYNSNGLTQIASHIIASDSSFYTLSYTPKNFTYDHKWHKVKIAVEDASYTLSYRRGYFADEPGTPPPGSEQRKPLFLAKDSMPTAAPDIHSSPLLFQAGVHPANDPLDPSQTGFVPISAVSAARKGATAFAVDYSLSTAPLSSALIDGVQRSSVAFAVLAFDSDGSRVGHSFDRVRFPVTPGSPPRQLKVQQQIDLPKGSAFLTLVVWDTLNGRLGTLEIPVNVPAPLKTK